MDDAHDMNASGTPQEGAPSQETTTAPDDEADLARVAALVARAGLPLAAAEIATLVREERYDRAGFERMRAMLASEDETAHTFQAARIMRRSAAEDGDSSTTRDPSARTDPSGFRDPSDPRREARP